MQGKDKLPEKSQEFLDTSLLNLQVSYLELAVLLEDSGINIILDNVVQDYSSEINMNALLGADTNPQQVKNLLQSTLGKGFGTGYIDGFKSDESFSPKSGIYSGGIIHTGNDYNTDDYTNYIYPKSYNEAKAYNMFVTLKNTPDDKLTEKQKELKSLFFLSVDGEPSIGDKYISDFRSHILDIVNVLDREYVLSNIENYLKKEGVAPENILKAIENTRSISQYNGQYGSEFDDIEMVDLVLGSHQGEYKEYWNQFSDGLLRDLKYRYTGNKKFGVVANAINQFKDSEGMTVSEYLVVSKKRNKKNAELDSIKEQGNSEMDLIIEDLKHYLRDGILEKKELYALLEEDRRRYDNVEITHIECQLKDGTIKNLTPKEVKEQEDNIGEFKRLFVWNEGKNGTKAQTLSL